MKNRRDTTKLAIPEARFPTPMTTEGAHVETFPVIQFSPSCTKFRMYASVSAAPDGAYVFALDKNKFRYRVQDGADLYQILAETVS